MAMSRVCDLCGKPVRVPFRQMKVNDAKSEAEEPRNYKTVGSYDFHLPCYSKFYIWLKQQQKESGMFPAEDKEVAQA